MRYAVVVMSFIVGATVGIFFHNHLIAPPFAQAAGAECAIPKSYGTFKAYADFLAFEAADGTLRFVERISCNIVSTMVRK